jgi:hypothetical protein
VDNGFRGKILIRSQDHHHFMGFVNHDIMRYHFTQMQGLKMQQTRLTRWCFIIGICPKESLFDRLQLLLAKYLVFADYKQLHVLKQTVIAPKEWFW